MLNLASSKAVNNDF